MAFFHALGYRATKPLSESATVTAGRFNDAVQTLVLCPRRDQLVAPVVEHPIVFYDGDCGLCDRFVRWMLRRDRGHHYRFAPLQGETAAFRKLVDDLKHRYPRQSELDLA